MDLAKKEIVIKTEDEAWQLLQSVEDGLAQFEEDETIIFDGWPFLNVYVPEPKVNASITPVMMEAFIDLQKAIYRSVAFHKYGNPNPRCLTAEDRRKYEIQVVVKEGSSFQNAELAKIFSDLASELSTKMTPLQITATVITLGLAFAGVVGYRHFVNARKEERIAQTHSDERKAQLDASVQLSQQETERMKVFASVTAKMPDRDVVEKSSMSLHDSLLKAAAETKGAKILDQDIDPDIASEIRKSTRRKSEISFVEKKVKVIDVNTADPLKVSVVLSDEASGDHYSLQFGDGLLAAQERQAIIQALDERAVVWARIKVKNLEGEIVPLELLAVCEFVEGVDPVYHQR